MYPRKPDCRNTLTPEQKDAALDMRADGKTWAQIARHFGRDNVPAFAALIRKHESRTRELAKRPNGRPRRKPDWTEEEHAILVKMAPTGCGAQAIVEALAAAYPEGGRDVNAVRRHASSTKVPIVRSPESYSNLGGSNANRGEAVFAPPRPYAKPAEVFAGVSFAAPTDRPLRGVARPERAPGRVGLPPETRTLGGMWSGGVVGSGDVA